MPWFAIRTFAKQAYSVRDAILSVREEELNSAKTEEERKQIPVLDFFVPPIQDIRLHDEDKKQEKPIGLLFINIADTSFLKTYRKKCAFKYNIQFYPMYDNRLQRYIEVPERQLDIFRKIKSEEIPELYVLSKPFSVYGQYNDRYVILEAPLKGVEGYRINLFKGKSIAIDIGGMTLAVRANSKFKIARIFDKHKDKIFAHQQPERLVCHLIGCLQVNGFCDDAYERLSELISLSNLCNDNFSLLEQKLKAMSADSPESKKMHNLVHSFDGLTAGYLISISSHLASGHTNLRKENLLKPRRILPFLTPTSGYLGNLSRPFIMVEHDDFFEVIKQVTISERIYSEETKKSTKVPVKYYAHIGIDKTTGIIFCDFTTFRKFLEGKTEEAKGIHLSHLQTNESPLYPILKDQDDNFILDATHGLRLRESIPSADDITSCMDKIDSLILKGEEIITHMFSSSRMSEWRPLLSEVWIHADI